jgi:large subunit ribosomal protein L10
VKRADKLTIVSEMTQEFERSPHVILASFRGLTVNQAGDLRGRVRATGGRYRVIKNRLARRAAAGTQVEGLSEKFCGPCALATHETDPVSLAKALSDFAKDNPELEVLGGLIDARDMLDAAQVKKLASLPSLDELRAQLLALISTPATTLVRLLNTPGTQLARVVDARAEQGDAAPADAGAAAEEATEASEPAAKAEASADAVAEPEKADAAGGGETES